MLRRAKRFIIGFSILPATCAATFGVAWIIQGLCQHRRFAMAIAALAFLAACWFLGMLAAIE